MGCMVNGPGEAREADLGVACGRGTRVQFKNGRVLAKVAEKDIVPALLREIGKMKPGR
jgi:(E)-4-hydroxy-3-methylbut-2-enyl-diphosphate synthase